MIAEDRGGPVGWLNKWIVTFVSMKATRVVFQIKFILFRGHEVENLGIRRGGGIEQNVPVRKFIRIRILQNSYENTSN